MRGGEAADCGQAATDCGQAGARVGGRACVRARVCLCVRGSAADRVAALFGDLRRRVPALSERSVAWNAFTTAFTTACLAVSTISYLFNILVMIVFIRRH